MANYGPADVTISYDNASGTPVDISQYVLTMGDIDVEEMIEETRPFGNAWQSHTPVGVGMVPDIEFGGLYEDATLDPLFANRVPEGPSATTRTLTVAFGGSKTFSVETYLKTYRRSINKNEVTKYTVILAASGAVTEV